MAGKIQNEDIKTAAELVSAGATAASLPNDDKVYVSALSINKTLKQAIIDGDIGTGASTAYGLATVDISAGNKTVSTGNTLTIPYLEIASGHTYTVSAGARLLVLGDFTMTGNLTLVGSGKFEMK